MSETVVFFGSGPVAARSLELLVSHHPVEAVITKPRPAHHRGPVPVLDVAERLGLTVYTADSRASLDTLFAGRPVRSRLAVLIDFGIIVSQSVIDYFPLGIVNSHFSLLPQWRGADPITFALLSGQSRTGVSLMLLVEKMDEGPLLAQAAYDIKSNDDNTSLTTALVELSDQLLAQTLPIYIGGNLAPYEQVEDSPLGQTLEVSYSRKLTKQDGLLDISKPAATLEREIRAYNEWPKSHLQLAGTEAIITKAHVATSTTPAAPGALRIDGKALLIGTGDNWLAIDRLKPAGKVEMDSAAFLAGYKHKLAISD